MSGSHLLDGERVAMVDGHVHAWSGDAGSSSFDPLASFSLGGDDPDFLRSGEIAPSPDELDRLATLAPATLVYQYGVELLAARLGCEPTVEAVREARRVAASDFPAYVADLYTDMDLGAMLVDTGHPVGTRPQTSEELTGVPSRGIFRIEPVIAKVWDHCDNLDALVRTVLDHMAESRERFRSVGFKSVVAYRTGLAVEPVTAAEAGVAFDRLKMGPYGQGLMARIHVPAETVHDVKRVRDHLLWRALETSIDLRAPFQIHAGLGDQDLDIKSADPGLLAHVLRDPRLRAAKVVLLHGAYPYHEKAAYLANVFPNVYVDLSLFNPFLVGGTARVLRSMLELAPYTKLLASTDAYGSPELHWVGVTHARRSLAAAIDDALGWSNRRRDLGATIWRRVLRDNAVELYELDGIGGLGPA